MEKGELKRLLEEFGNNNFADKDNTIANILSGYVDLAKEEFPMSKSLLDGLNGDSITLGSIGTCSIVEIAKWFKKWYGVK